MIAFLEGKLEEKNLEKVILNVGGVGYEILIPLSTYEKLPASGKIVKFYISESVGMYGGGTTFYGFFSMEEKEIFSLLCSVPKVGPKDAIKIIGKISKSFADFKRAIVEKNSKILASFFGLTKKQAEKLIVGLGEKIKKVSIKGHEKIPQKPQILEAIQALIVLGYKEDHARQAVISAQEIIKGELTTEKLVKAALKQV